MSKAKGIGYCRVSHESQVESGLGVEAQRGAILRASKALGVSIVGWRLDAGISGSCVERPGLIRAIEDLEEGDSLFVSKRDRLSREMMLSCWIEKEVSKKRAKIVSAAEDGTNSDEPTAILMRRIVDSFAEYERKVIAARTKAALQAKRARGERVGKIPFGFSLEADGVTLVEDDREQHAIGLMLNLRDQGWSYRKVIEELERRQIKAKSGGKWHPQVVKDICRRAAA